jgi:hypothetical protein
MIGKLPKSEAWKQSDTDRLGLLLHPRYSSRASAPELRGGLPTSQEALRLSEPRHSPDKDTPSYYTKNESFASGISKVWCVCVDFHCEEGIYMCEWDLHRLGDVSLVPGGGRAANLRIRPVEWSGVHQLSPPTRASPPHVDTW